MQYRVRMSDKALQDADDVLRWFQEQRATSAGARWYQQLLAKIGTLEQRPERCGLALEAEDLGLELRELLFGRRRGMYRILFVIEGRRVEILRIRHSARDTLSPGDV
ncbi:MAG: type II toxin-antitoxin system RelE/ParE family toxin [Planctomycetaceae bacterium]|nr:type II toxin-antitoxin system RelE/ParE family toxin [Planctomycetaceae bacterium]